MGRMDENPFKRFEHENVLALARAKPPQAPIPTASAFGSWIINLNYPREATSSTGLMRRQRMLIGSIGERLIEEYKLWAREAASVRTMELFYADPLDGSKEAFRSSKLLLDGKPITGKPDVVLKDPADGGIVLIVERKLTTLFPSRIPPGCWPNVPAQLWCYSWMDEWEDASEVILRAEVWHQNIKTGRNHRVIDGLTWYRSDNSFSPTEFGVISGLRGRVCRRSQCLTPAAADLG